MADLVRLSKDQPKPGYLKVVTNYGDTVFVPREHYVTLYSHMTKYFELGSDSFDYVDYIKENPWAAVLIPIIVKENPDFENSYYMDECAEEVTEVALRYISKFGQRTSEENF